MAGTWRVLLVASILLAAVVPSAHGLNGRFGMSSSSSSSRSSSYAAPIYYYYCPPGPMVLPVPDAFPRMPYAKPMPAPPSSSAEPPLGMSDSRAPKISTTRSANSASSSGNCRVGFWNLTGRDVSLTIEGKAWALAKNQVLTFTVERQFTWQVAGKSQQVERVADGLATYEVIIRE